MKNYFIHTIELMKPIDTERFKAIKSKAGFYPVDWCFVNHYKNTEFCKKGLTIELRKCSKNEIMAHKKPYLLILIINPSKVMHNSDPLNHIFDRDVFDCAVEQTFDMIDELVDTYGLFEIDEYTLSIT